MKLCTITNIVSDFFNVDIENHDIKKMKYGIANAVYKVSVIENDYIIKVYKVKTDFRFQNCFMNMCIKCGVRCVYPLNSASTEFSGMQVNIYPFIKGQHHWNINELHIDKLIELLNTLPKYNNDTVGPNLLRKINMYASFLINCNFRYIDEKKIIWTLERYNDVLNLNCFLEQNIAHADLGPSNIIWQNKSHLYIIDFDECCVAPLYYDWLVLAVKHSISTQGDFNKKIFEAFLDAYYKMGIDTAYINKLFSLYCIKVLFEKWYFIENEYIKESDQRQMKDPWSFWFELLVNIYR